MKDITYTFKFIENCNFCGAGVDALKVLGKRLNNSQGKNPSNKIGITTTIMKCTNCELIFSSPLPVPESLQDHYGTPPEDYWIDSYFVVNDNYFEPEFTVLKKLTTVQEGFKTLDIGAGIGKCMIALSRRGCDAFGLEPSEPFYFRAIEKMGLSSDKLKCCSIEEANYPNGMFDFVTFGAVLEHLYDPSESIEKALKWLKPGGLIHIEVPSSRWLINKIGNLYYKLIGTDYVANISPMHSPFHLYEFSTQSFEKNSEKLDYEIAFSSYSVCMTYMPKWVDVFVKPLMKWTDTGMQLEIWLRKK